jgi:hypothetical protein
MAMCDNPHDSLPPSNNSVESVCSKASASKRQIATTVVVAVATPVLDFVALTMIRDPIHFSRSVENLRILSFAFPLCVAALLAALVFLRPIGVGGGVVIACVGVLVTLFNFWLLNLLSGPLV